MKLMRFLRIFSHISSAAPNRIVLLFVIFPIPITALVNTIISTDTKLGILERDGNKCIVLLPTKKFQMPDKIVEGHTLLPEECGKHSVVGLEDSEDFVVWERVDEGQDFLPIYNCPYSNCINQTLKFAFYFPDCLKEPTLPRLWYGFSAVDLFGCFILAECVARGDPTKKQYFYSNLLDTRSVDGIAISSEEIIQNSLFYSMNLVKPDTSDNIFLFETSNLSDTTGLTMLAFDTANNNVSKIMLKSNITTGPDKSIPCSRSNQHGSQAFLLCWNSGTKSNYLFSFSIEELDRNPHKNEAKLKLLSQFEDPAKFAPEIMGINVFTTKYPKELLCFIVSSKNSWYTLVLESEQRKLAGECYAPESRVGRPYLCPLVVPGAHTPKYISIMNNTLWMQSSFGDRIVGQTIKFCYLMNDCFGCVSIGTKTAFNCKWDYDRCINARTTSPTNVSDCIYFDKKVFSNSTDPSVWNLHLELSGVHLTNNYMEVLLETPDGNKVKPLNIGKREAEFFLDREVLQNVKSHKNTTYLWIGNGLFPSIEAKIALDKNDTPPIRNGKSSEFWGTVIFIFFMVVVIFIVTMVTWFAFRKSKFSEPESLTSEVSSLRGESSTTSI